MQLVRHLVAEAAVELLDERQLFAPSFRVDLEEAGHVGLGHVEPLEVDGVERGQHADGRVHRLAGAVAPLEYPLEHAAVVTEARPQKATVLATTEPVDEEDLRQLRAVAL